MGPDRHLVCWEISLGRSERLPSPLPAPAHQMWGEGHILALCAQRPGCALSFCFSSHGTAHSGSSSNTYRHKHAVWFTCWRINKSFFPPHLCSSPSSPLLLSTILHRSEATSSFCWLVRLRLGSCSWQAQLSDKLNSRYGTKACWSSSQYSRLHGT